MNTTASDKVVELKILPEALFNVEDNKSTIFVTSFWILRYVFRTLPNIRLTAVKLNSNPKNAISAWEPAYSPRRALHAIGKVHLSQPYDSYGHQIYSCLDGQGKNSRLLLPDEALGTSIWPLLLMSYLTISFFTALVFRRGIMGRNNTLLQRISDSCFFYYSHLVSNAGDEGSNGNLLSWKLLLSGWLLGAGFLLNRFYLCNMKGELVTGKIPLIDTIAQLLVRKDIKRIYIQEMSFNELKISVKSPETNDLLKRALFRRGNENDILMNTEAVFFSNDLAFRYIFGDLKTERCRNVFEGRVEYFKQSMYLALSSRLPPTLKEIVDWRVLRYIETRQRQISDFVDEFTCDRLLAKSYSLIRSQTEASIHFLESIFKAWYFGMILSIVIHAIEWIYYHLAAIFQRKN